MEKGFFKFLKKGIFFSADALIALIVVFVILIFAIAQREELRYETEIHHDVLETLSTLKAGEVDSSYVRALIADGKISDLNKSLLEIIGEFYVTDVDEARLIAQSVLKDVNVSQNFGIWYGSTLIFAKNSTPFENAKDVDTTRKILSGIAGTGNGSVTGFSARAFLSNSLLTKYFYFGGYVGDGNISLNLSYSGNITSAEVELAINKDFEVYINGNHVGNYQKSLSEFVPAKYNLSTQFFHSGNNLVEFKGNSLHIAGGFVKIIYKSEVEYQQPEKYIFPGIEGLINLYDGFYIPGDLNFMEIFLRINSTNLSVFLNVGNVTIYNGSSSGQGIRFDNEQLSSLLDYQKLSKKTTPLRLGLENVSFISQRKNVDVFSVTDISGSMGGQKIADAKAANNLLIDAILNYSGNGVGLAGYDTWAKKNNFHALSDDNTSLKNTINTWNAGGYTCICCGILKSISCFDSDILKDGFNGQLNGSNPTGWSLSEGNGRIDIVSPGLEGDRAVLIARLSSQNPLMGHYFAPQEDKVSFEFLVKQDSGSGRVRIELEGATNGFSTSTFEDYIIIKMYNGQIRNGDTAVVAYNLNTIYKIRIEVVPGASTYDLYVNDALVGNDIPVYSTRSNVVRATFTTESSSVSYNIDDVKVFLTDRICNEPSQEKAKAMIVMSDGFGNRACGLDPVSDYNNNGDITDDPSDHAIQAACNAYQIYNITVHAVGFGNGADEATLQRIASCGNGSYYFADVGELADLYSRIADDIIRGSYSEQTLSINGSVFTKLYSDSYILFNYTKTSFPFGLVLTLQKQFINNYSGSFTIPNDVSVLETKASSYSGAKWTDFVSANENEAYNLSRFGDNYIPLGDPYIVEVPVSLITTGNNFINLTIGVSPQNSSEGSEYNKIIYTILKNATAFSPIVASANGCIWHIQFEDNSTVNTAVPSNYTGSDECYYDEITLGRVANENDALQIAVLYLLRSLDIDLNGKVDFLFTENDLQISLSQITGIPFTWSSEVQARRWY